jgi:hypothetical protein
MEIFNSIVSVLLNNVMALNNVMHNAKILEFYYTCFEFLSKDESTWICRGVG